MSSNDNPQKIYITIGAAAKLLGVTMNTLRNWDASGKLKPYRHPISKYRLYKIDEINKLLEEIVNSKGKKHV